MQSNNTKLAYALLALVVSMTFLSFASAPIYNLFCKVTGYGGTTQRALVHTSHAGGTRQLTVEFDANVEPKLPWRFFPKQRRVSVTTGQNILVFYESENISNTDIVGTAIYNVTPTKAGKYFTKIHCFCFEEQLLTAKEKKLMPVSFFIDPAFDLDPEMSDVKVITLSYSFFSVNAR